MKRYGFLVLILVASVTPTFSDGWVDDLLQLRAAARKLPAAKQPSLLPGFDASAYTVSLWIKTRDRWVPLWAITPAKGKWIHGGKALTLHGGGTVESRDPWIRSKGFVMDGKWHHVVLVHGHTQQIWIDGNLQAEKSFPSRAVPKGCVFKIGYASENWGNKHTTSLIDDVQVYPRALSEKEIQAVFTEKKPARDCVVHCSLDGPEPVQKSGHRAKIVGKPTFEKGMIGNALCPAEGYLEIGPAATTVPSPWEQLGKTHSAEALTAEMTAARRDGIWTSDWAVASPQSIAARYAAVVEAPAHIAKEIQAKALAAKTDRDLKAIHALYLKSFRYTTLMASLGNYELESIAKAIQTFYKKDGKGLLVRLNALKTERDAWATKLPDPAALAAWKSKVNVLRLTAVLGNNPTVDFDKVLFVKRRTYNADHYYTKFINSRWRPGGNLCVLNIKTGKVHELTPELKDGVFERFDLSYDASKIVFAWKAEQDQGYRLYEIDIDPKTGQRTGTPVRSVTLPPKDEAEIQKKYRNGYHHGTDDMSPCYLPDGGIAFVSTRCQYGILCNHADSLSTSILYRMDGDGKNMKPLTNSSLSENSPAVLNDGRIMYTRWEYVDKGAVSVKCLWAMNPDGSRSVEIYGADIPLPPTMIHGRPIPGSSSEYVFLGVPHYPQNNMGTVIRIDMTKEIRTREPMTYMTPYVDIKGEGGFAYRNEAGRWRGDARGWGPLFADPYPLSRDLFLVSQKPAGKEWQDATGYRLCLLKESGQTFPFHSEEDFSCWEPYPLKTRNKPPVPNGVSLSGGPLGSPLFSGGF